MRSVTGIAGNILIKELDDNSSEIVFGGGTASSAAGNILMGQLFVIKGMKPIAKKVCKIISERINKRNIPPLTMKKCPYCGEKIKIEALVCRYCNKDLEKV